MGEPAYKINPEVDPVKKFKELTDNLNNAGTEVNKFSTAFTDEAIKKVDSILGKNKNNETLGTKSSNSEVKKPEVYELESFGKRDPEKEEIEVELKRIMSKLPEIEKKLGNKNLSEGAKDVNRKVFRQLMDDMPSKEICEDKFKGYFNSIEEFKKRIELLS